jgi:hypothetical protein
MEENKIILNIIIKINFILLKIKLLKNKKINILKKKFNQNRKYY